MRGKKVKAICKEVYGDFSIRNTEYQKARENSVTLLCVGLRKQYKEKKKSVK